MKILAIRGSNLASLASEFAIEFEKDPLAGAGLFAICGPTGAGKSTLLDALCVALFDKTPRLCKTGGAPIGLAGQGEKDRLAANDVRGLLRRGTAEGFAEVDFLGRDQRRYRARWEVRRARKRADGRFQDQVMFLEDLDSGGERLTRTKTETLSAIEDKLGLSFEQFTRSALLAQGEFAAFLRADERFRGDLLERMTGTEIYSVLSKAAFERKKKELEALGALNARVNAHAVLEEDARQALEAEHEGAKAALAAIDEEIAGTERALAWYGKLDELMQHETAARDTVRAIELEWQDAAGARREIEEIEAAREYRPVVEAVARCAAAMADAEAQLAAAGAGHEACRDASEAAEEVAKQAEAELAAARDAYQQAEPELARAEKLDTRLEGLEQAAGHAETAWREAELKVRAGRSERDRLSKAVAAGEALKTEITAWLAGHVHLEPLAGQWPRWQSALKGYVKLDADRARLDAARPELLAGDERARQAWDKARDEHRNAQAAYDKARAVADKAQHEADATPLDGARRDIDTMMGRARNLSTLERAARDAAEAAGDRDRHGEQAQSAAREAGEAGELTANLAGELKALHVLHGEAKQALDRMRLAVDLSAHRGALVPGEPCTLCGSREHPWAKQASPVDAMLAEQQARVDELVAQNDRLKERRTRAEERAEAATRRAAECKVEIRRAEGKLAGARATWRAEVKELGELALIDDPADPAAAESVRSRLQAVELELERLRELERRAVELSKQARHDHSVAESRKSDLDHARHALDEREAEARHARAALDEHDRERERLTTEMGRIAGELTEHIGPALAAMFADGSWTDELSRRPQALAARCASEVAAWDKRHGELARVDSELVTDRGKLDSAMQLLAEHEERERDLHDQHQAKADELGQVRAERQSVLGGRDPAAVRAALKLAIDGGESKFRDASKRREDRAVALATASERVRAGERGLREKQDEQARAHAALVDALARSGLSEAVLRERCAVSDAELLARKNRVAELDRRRDKARAVLKEREDQRVRHERDNRPELDRDKAVELASERREARKQAASDLYEIEVKLRTDDDARKARAAMADEVARQEQRARLYETLSELIGSSDGKKFRVFAQSLTLDALLAYANHHLADLAGRYRLVRVPGHDLDLQVIDRDMGDEVRSVNSLSGGESFLVSLALALGLSSLAARDTQVESLLIDEGFGSLDPATLEIALSVLDALQASGRKVGLISHVPGLAERVGVRILVRPQGGGRSEVRIAER